jgi:cystathionine beta-lyase family protein involved in aluminum resistance
MGCKPPQDDRVLRDCAPVFARLAEVSHQNTRRVLRAFRQHRVSDAHFAGTTGYGYNDAGRDTLDKLYAEVFGAEDALVRVQFVNGTHALVCALRACMDAAGSRDGYLSLVGEPYDTLRAAAPYRAVPCDAQGRPDWEAIEQAVKADAAGCFFIQRSRGYSERAALGLAEIERLTALCKRLRPESAVLVDNCYGEFVETGEPTQVGADLIAGSLIKNPGGGLAVSGGYIAGRRDLVQRAAEYLTAPGIGREAGSSMGQNRLLFQGFLAAPHVVSQALCTAAYAARLLEELGYGVSPRWDEPRYDIIQSVRFGDREKLLRFCRGLQRGSPVDSFAAPEPWDMPGYDCPVVMAAGTFVQGASIELSCDAPMRPPFTAYLQGGLTFEAGRAGILEAVQAL